MPRPSRPWYRASRESWYATVKGRQIDLGVTDPTAEAAALAALEQILKATEGRVSGPGKVVTVAQAVTDYLASAKKRVRPHTYEMYAWYLGQFSLAFGPKSVAEVTGEELEEDARRSRWSSSTRHDYLSMAISALKRAGVVLKVVKPPKTSAGAKSVIPESTFRRMLQHVSGDWHACLNFLWHTGARPSEASAVTAEMVDWEQKVIRLTEHKTSHHAGGGDRLIYLNQAAFEVVTWQRDLYGTGLLFRSRTGDRLNRRSFVRMFFKLSRKVGRRVNSYGLRHSWATRALAAGESDKIVSALLGHADTAMVSKHYGHVSEMGRALRDAAERIGRQAS